MYTGTISGKKLSFSIGGTMHTMAVSFTFNDNADELDATVGGDGGYGDSDGGVQQGDFDLRLLIDVTSGLAAVFKSRTQLTDLAFYYDFEDATPCVSAAKAIILNVQRSIEVKGRCEATCRGKTRGAYTVNK